jgi:hypothetical protein
MHFYTLLVATLVPSLAIARSLAKRELAPKSCAERVSTRAYCENGNTIKYCNHVPGGGFSTPFEGERKYCGERSCMYTINNGEVACAGVSFLKTEIQKGQSEI